MFRKLIRKDPPAAASNAAPAPEADTAQSWQDRLDAAKGDDAALLALAREAPNLELKLSAVLALSSEDMLREAEREFRTHDRRVHRAAKQRYEAQVAQRRTRVQADELIEATAALAAEALIPANRLVEIDQAWQAIAAGLVDETQKARFATVREHLAERVRERGERQRGVARWIGDAGKALAAMAASGATVTTPAPDRVGLRDAGDAARRLLADLPAAPSLSKADAEAVAALEAGMQAALQEAELIEARLAVLDQLADIAPDAPAEAATAQWRTLAPLADKRLHKALDARFDEWQHQREAQHKKRQGDERQHAAQEDKAARQARMAKMREAGDAAEAARAAGTLAEAAKQLARMQAALEHGGADAAMQARAERLQAELARLKGWQRWGGGRARDELVEEAEALARSTASDAPHAAKVSVRELESRIEALRTKWKEVDRLGGATSKAIWERFDAALKTAYLPVAAHAEKLKQARRDNLAAREKLLDALDAAAIDGEAPDWKEIGRALAHFESEWRKLGPVEHAVPHKKQPALLARMKASVARIEQPLQQARRGAQAERQQLIARAKALADDAHNRDAVARVRELQAEWQQHAKAHPLLRKTENALWAEFKAATDAVMKQREEAYRSRQAERNAHQAEREAIIARVDAIAADTPPADIKRALAAADAEWRKAGEAPKERAAALDNRYRRARETALKHIADSARMAWYGTCDALATKLALCEEAEAAAGTAVAESEARWAALPSLPFGWEAALHGRFKAGLAGTADKRVAADGTLDGLLLRLEAALNIPSPLAFEAARRSLKLLAMKNALEKRQGADPADLKQLAATAFACPGADDAQRQRLAAIVAALRAMGPKELG